MAVTTEPKGTLGVVVLMEPVGVAAGLKDPIGIAAGPKNHVVVTTEAIVVAADRAPPQISFHLSAFLLFFMLLVLILF